MRSALDISELLRRAESEAARWDRDGLPADVIGLAGKVGIFGADRQIATAAGLDTREIGLLAADLGAVCTSLRSLLTVTGMVSAAVDRWGTQHQREQWLPALVGGELIAGFAVTEEGAGTDLAAVRARFDAEGDDWLLTGRKLWITFGEIADVLLVLGTTVRGPMTALVRTDVPGVRVEPVTDQLGLRGARLAHITFDGVRVPHENVLAPAGFGLSHVVGTALDHGRFTVAWGCVGMAHACLADAAAHAARQRPDGTASADHQVVRAQLGRSWLEVRSARELCHQAAELRDQGDPEALPATIAAKYAAAGAAARVSHDAVQLMGAAGCAPDSRAARFFRDAKIMEIIEGSTQVAELHMGDHVLALARSGELR